MMKQEDPNTNEIAEALAVEDADEGVAKQQIAPDSGIAMTVPTVSWSRQLNCVLSKNFYLISRRPFTIFLMMFSSVLSVLLAWSSGRDDPDWDFDEIPLAACGNVEDSFLRSMNYTESQSVPLSHNENWRDGLAVTLMGKFIIQFEMLCDVRQTYCVCQPYCVLRLPAPKSINVESSWCKFGLVKKLDSHVTYTTILQLLSCFLSQHWDQWRTQLLPF
jgi:hypothetical protein